MALIPLAIPPGVYRNGTDFEASNRWRDTSLVRWRDGSLRPVGGWSARIANAFNAAPRGMIAWDDNSADTRLAAGTYNYLYAVSTNNVVANITPVGFNPGILDASVNTAYGGTYFGTGFYGVQRPSSGIYQECTTWALDTWGEYLVGCTPDDGKLYEWQLNRTYGSELVTNGDFASGTGWTIGANWAVTGGVAEYDRTIFTIDATDALVVDVVTDTITITAHGLSDGDPVLYTVSAGQTDIGGLTSGTTYYVTNTTTNTVQLAATQSDALAGTPIITLTAVGTGTTDTFTDLRQETIEQSISTTASRPYEVQITLAGSGSGEITVIGDNTTTVLLQQVLSAGTHILRFDSDDTAVTIGVKPETATEDTFTIDDVSVKLAPYAEQIANSPEDCASLVVTEERFLFALGAELNPRKIMWCDREDNTEWTPDETNEAGDIELQTTGQIMCGLRLRGKTLILTNTDAHTATYSGPPFVYGFERVGTSCGVVARKAAAAVKEGAFWMGQNGFFMFDGSVAKEIPCDVWDYVFLDINASQISKVYAVQNSQYGEIWWFYPSKNSTENNRYVAYDYIENHWEIGEIDRTAGVDTGVFTRPIWADASGNIYDQEQNPVIGHGSYTPYAETGPISLGNGDSVMKVNNLIPDELSQGDVEVTFKTRFHPNDTARSYGPYSMTNPTSVRFTGRQIRMRVEAAKSSAWRAGVMRIEAIPGGRR